MRILPREAPKQSVLWLSDRRDDGEKEGRFVEIGRTASRDGRQGLQTGSIKTTSLPPGLAQMSTGKEEVGFVHGCPCFKRIDSYFIFHMANVFSSETY